MRIALHVESKGGSYRRGVPAPKEGRPEGIVDTFPCTNVVRRNDKCHTLEKEKTSKKRDDGA
jgi:hypothetical protein